MSNMVLQCKESSDFKPHPEGIHPATCVDVIDLGLMETEWQGQRRMTPKVRVVFESEQRTEDGRPMTISKTFTASLHPKARLSEWLGKWRGRPVVPGESIDLQKLIGACCTLVVSQQQNMVGRTYAAIDAISKPTRKLAASGQYDPVAARQRIAERGEPPRAMAPSAQGQTHHGSTPMNTDGRAGATYAHRPEACAPGQHVEEDDVPFDPEVGF